MDFVVWVSTRLEEIPKELGKFPTLEAAKYAGENWDTSRNKGHCCLSGDDVFITTGTRGTGNMLVWFPPSKEWLEV